MRERLWSVSNVLVRTIAVVALADMGFAVITTKYFKRAGYLFANSPAGTFMTFWVIASCLFLPLYVVFEAWWMRKNKAAMSALWVDALMAIACFVFLVAIVLYGWTHYAMY